MVLLNMLSCISTAMLTAYSRKCLIEILARSFLIVKEQTRPTDVGRFKVIRVQVYTPDERLRL